VAIQLPQMGSGDLEANGSIFWKGVFVSSDTVPHRFGFHIENMSLYLQDDSGLYDLTNPLVAELGGEIRFGLGSDPLDPSDTIYAFAAELYAAGIYSAFELDTFNPTGAAAPTFTQFSFGTFHSAFAPNFDAFVDLGLIPAGQPFTLEYRAFTHASSPGRPTSNTVSGESRFGDPFDPTAGQPDSFSFQLQTTPIPEPSSMLVFGVTGGILLMASLFRGRKKRSNGNSAI